MSKSLIVKLVESAAEKDARIMRLYNPIPYEGLRIDLEVTLQEWVGDVDE
jgi:hypothetical protein